MSQTPKHSLPQAVSLPCVGCKTQLPNDSQNGKRWFHRRRDLSLTLRVSDGGPMAADMKQERHRAVHCTRLVRCHILVWLSFGLKPGVAEHCGHQACITSIFPSESAEGTNHPSDRACRP